MRKPKLTEKVFRRPPTQPTKDEAIEMLRDALQEMIDAYEGYNEPESAHRTAVEAMVRTEHLE